MDSVDCPVEGCEYSGSLGSVRAHVNASKDHPNWAKVQNQGKAPVEQSEADETGASEQADEQPEAEPEQSNSSAEEDVDEYEQQWEQNKSSEKQGKGGDGGDSKSSTGQAASSPKLPVSGTTLALAVVVLFLAAVLLYRLREQPSPTPADRVDQEASDEAGDDATFDHLLEGA